MGLVWVDDKLLKPRPLCVRKSAHRKDAINHFSQDRAIVSQSYSISITDLSCSMYVCVKLL